MPRIINLLEGGKGLLLLPKDQVKPVEDYSYENWLHYSIRIDVTAIAQGTLTLKKPNIIIQN